MTYKVFIDNPYLKEMNGKIIKKEFKDNKSYIQLDRTIFYPNLAGGQPMDYGTINGLEVLDVYEEDDKIVHVIKGDITTTRVHLAIDWDRRLDLMQQHTGEHLLASSFHRLFNATTVGLHIGDEYNTIDIEKPYLNEEEAIQVEYLANKVIQSNFKVKSYYVNHDQLSKIPLRKNTTIKDEKIRIIEIDNLDYIACCGTHLSSTGEIGLIKILRWERYKGNIRVVFVCGTRAVKDYSWKNRYINEIGKLLSAKDIDVLEKVNQLYNVKETIEKQNRNLREELYKIKGDSFLKESIVDNNINYIIKELKDLDIKQISLIASNLNQNTKNLVQIYSIINKDLGQFLITRSRDLSINLREIYKEVSNKYNIKGGGSPQMIQGASSHNDLNKIINMFKREIRSKF